MKWKLYIAGLIDLAGQGSKLKELGSLFWKRLWKENTLIENDRIIDLEKETYGFVEEFRNLFTTSFDNFKNITLKHPTSSLSGKERAEIEKAAKDICVLGFFSDSALFYLPFDAKNKLSTYYRIAATLYACTCVSQIGFKYGNFFRGGLEIGMATKLGNGDIYGPVLFEVNNLEKEVADYPRIVTGKQLSLFIQKNNQVENSVNSNAALSRIDKFCKTMIYCDDDGEFAIDYIGKGIADLSRSSYKPIRDSVKQGIEKIEESLCEQIKSNNSELVIRYGKLLAYYRSRMKLWDNQEAEKK